jgi:Mrp family chromosome partitioning ATPase
MDTKVSPETEISAVTEVEVKENSELESEMIEEMIEETDLNAEETADSAYDSVSMKESEESHEKSLVLAADADTAKKAKKSGRNLQRVEAEGKLPLKERKARNTLAKLVQRKTDLEARLFQVFQRLEVEPSFEAPLVIGVTSSLRGEGRSTVATVMALTLVKSLPYPVLLVEGDVGQTRTVPVEAENTLCQYLRGESSLQDLVQPTSTNDLWFIPAGDSHNQPLRVLRSDRLEKLFEEARQQYPIIVVDMPPFVQSAEAGRLLGFMDKVVMVVESGSTPRKLLKENLTFIEPDKLGAVVLNRTKMAMPRWLAKLFSIKG